MGTYVPDLVDRLQHNLSQMNWITAVIGVLATGFPFLGPQGPKTSAVTSWPWAPAYRCAGARAGPVVVVVATTGAVWGLGLAGQEGPSRW